MHDGESNISGRIRTMEEFSAASGISRPTLSRFFNDPTSVRPASREKIEEAMERLGYRPNLLAVNFNRRNPKTLGILVPTLMDPFYAALVQRIELQASSSGYWTVIRSSQGEPEREAEAVATLMSIKSAGAIVVPLGEASRKDLYRQMATAMPLVFLDARAEADGAFVGTNNYLSMSLMVDYLLRSGAPPSYFDMPDVNQNARERREAYVTSMRERGVEPRIFSVRSLDWDFERLAFEEATRLFKAGAPVGETVLCANDRVAFGVMSAACQSGISVGRRLQLRIAGHDDHPLSQYACPSLTTVAQDVERLATISLERVMQGISDRTNQNSTDLLEARLIMRESA
ncbi:LacI family DNA-binding transcriptional regulator [Methylocapsa sp. S129]|uniref:LacI family DNA-binding transcriptional regulator n=1 Tax=Methylocapsa sp. S129 TaxID=1641869 RepID=UPI00131EB3B7|nr:LacI family DNA-binding transcriptional regulator [Methylocapsa sp. S129]